MIIPTQSKSEGENVNFEKSTKIRSNRHKTENFSTQEA
jgi:hypothetical protein